MKSSTSISTPAVHWPRNPRGVLSALLLLLAICEQGQSLQISPSSSQVRFVSGRRAVIQCFLDNSDLGNNGVFSWSGPALTQEGHTSISLDPSGTLSTLAIYNVSAGHEGEYSCSYAGARDSTTLEVVAIAANDATFLNVKRHQKFAEGTDAVVRCPARFGDNSRMSWFRDDNIIGPESGRFAPEKDYLRIQNININDGGNYECRLRSGSNTIDKMIIQVEVLPQSKFTPKINDTIRRFEVAHGEPLTLPCKLVKKQENVTYSWTIDTEFEHDILKNTHAVLNRDATKFVSGRYTCRAENQYGYDETDFIVRINAMPLPSECTSVETITLKRTSTTVVLKSCDLTSPVQPSNLNYTWSKDGAPLDLNETRFTVNQFGLLTIENITEGDLGVYRVRISNPFGCALHTIKLVAPAASPALPMASAAQFQRFQDSGVPLSLKFTLSLRGTTNSGCTAVKEEAQRFIQRQILKDFAGYADVAIENVAIDCSFKSKRLGTFTATLRGSRARQLSASIKSKGISALTLKSGPSVTLEVCDNECSQLVEEESNKPWISKAGGVLVAVVVTAVMLAGVALLIVILVYYRRRSFTKNGIDEEELHLAPPTNSEKRFAKPKPPYYRSTSVNLPITSSTTH